LEDFRSFYPWDDSVLEYLTAFGRSLLSVTIVCMARLSTIISKGTSYTTKKSRCTLKKFVLKLLILKVSQSKLSNSISLNTTHKLIIHYALTQSPKAAHTCTFVSLTFTPAFTSSFNFSARK